MVGALQAVSLGVAHFAEVGVGLFTQRADGVLGNKEKQTALENGFHEFKAKSLQICEFINIKDGEVNFGALRKKSGLKPKERIARRLMRSANQD